MEETEPYLTSQPHREPDGKRYKFSKREIGLIVVVIIAIVGAGIFAWQVDKEKQASVNSFEECVAAGNPVMESWPEQCRAGDQTFTKQY